VDSRTWDRASRPTSGVESEVSGPVMLVVLDGFGIGDGGATDSTAVAHTPFFDRARAERPMAQVETSGEAVGLPPGQMGNSEVGHMTMGAGRIIEQDMTRINHALEGGELGRNAVVQEAFAALAERGGRLHLMGLVSDGGVHSHVKHLETLLAYCGAQGVEPQLHAFLDGRDTPPESGLGYLRELVPHVEAVGGKFATVIGRYYAMDRDNRWERVAEAYHAMVCREGETASDAVTAVEQAYARRETDEFVKPTVIDGGAPLGDGDVVIFFNFRSDRARELTRAFTEEGFDGFERTERSNLSRYVCLTEYGVAGDLPVVFPPQSLDNILGAILSERGISQFRTAETEKYPHVTFFFNGGVEQPYTGEDRLLTPSPKEVATYDLKPEMSACEVTGKLVERIEAERDSFILVNYANGDMVGHTGILEAAVSACETVDASIGQVVEAAQSKGWTILITADHGNSEQMIDYDTGEPHTAHTTNPVPFILVDDALKGSRLREGGLADVAPTILDLMKLERPKEMTGRSLINGD
jgi:2,3-bisphosphoglycerate-independent phosphoglycerate mutase